MMARKTLVAQTLARRCGVCRKTGHNKSTCSQLTDITQRYTAPTQPVRFFVHHVNHRPHESPHVVNLRTSKQSRWETVEPAAPVLNDKDSRYYFYHQQPKGRTVVAPSIAPAIDMPAFKPVKTPVKTAQPKNEAAAPLQATHSTQRTRVRISCWRDAVPRLNVRMLRRAAALVAATAVFAASILPLRSYYNGLNLAIDHVAAKSLNGFTELQIATTAMIGGNIATAQQSLTNALADFDEAITVLNTRHRLLQSIIGALPVVDSHIKSRQQLVLAGQQISLGNTYVLKGLGDIQSSSSTLTGHISTMRNHLKFALPHYQNALLHLSRIHPSILPEDQRPPFQEFRLLFASYINDLEQLTHLSQSLVEIFGGQGLRRYLLVFQNPHELRPTGGFVGSFAVLDMKDGAIVKLDVPAGGSYDLQGQLSQHMEPPTPLLLTNKRWEFQDANWFPDFPASAHQLMRLYRYSRNVTTDGIIAINADVLTRLLSIMGPVTETKRGVTLETSNALQTIQQIVEFGAEKKQHKPKQIIADLAPVFIEQIQQAPPDKLLSLLIHLHEALRQKEIQAYFTDERVQKTIREFGWSGAITPTEENQDYLYVVNTNIGGQKSDAYMKQTVSHQAVVEADGTIVNIVIITRRHTGSAGEALYGQPNIDYLRVYVPYGSTLLQASGFTWPDERAFKTPESWYKKNNVDQWEREQGYDKPSGTRITTEFGKTAFGNWVITKPGEMTQVQFTYRLPFKSWNVDQDPQSAFEKLLGNKQRVATYRLMVQKQSGINSSFESQIIYPDGWQPLWHQGSGVSLATNGAAIAHTVTTDSTWDLVMEKKL